jgi:membrane protease YdiL (CAAX protease family)
MADVNDITSPKKSVKAVMSRNELLFPFAIVLLMLSVFDLTGNVAGLGIYLFDIVNLLSDSLVISEEDAIKMINLLLNLSAQIGAILIFFILYRNNQIEPEEKTMPETKPVVQVYLLYAMEIAFLIIVLFAVDPLLAPLGESTSSYEAIFPSSALLAIPLYYILFFGVLVFGAAVSEELIFRRSIIPFLERRGLGTFWALIFSALMFSLIHVPADLLEFFYSNDGGALRFTINHFFGTFAGGITLGYIYMRTRDIKWPIIAHGFSNGFSGIVILGESILDEMLTSRGISLEELLTDLSEGSISVTSEQQIAFNIVWLGGLFTLISLIIGFGVFGYVGYQFMKFQKVENNRKPVWMRILTNHNIRKSNIKLITQATLGFVLIEGGRSIVIFLLSPLLDQNSLLINGIEIAFLSLLIIFLIYFVVRIGKPVEEPDYVSPLTYLTETSHPPSMFYPTASPVLTQSPGGFCGSCGKPYHVENHYYQMHSIVDIAVPSMNF